MFMFLSAARYGRPNRWVGALLTRGEIIAIDFGLEELFFTDLRTAKVASWSKDGVPASCQTILFLHFNQLKSQIKIETCFAHSWNMHCKNFQPKKTNFSPSYCPPNLRVDAKMASLRRAVKLAPIVFVLKWIHSVICSTLDNNNNKKVCSANDVIIIKGVQFRIFMTKDEQVAAGARSRKKAN